MAYKLAPSLRKVDRILKNRIFTGNFNLFAQAQPKSLEARQFLSQSSVYLSNKPKEFDKFFSPKEGKKGATNVGERRAAEQNMDMKGNIASSTLSPKSARKGPNNQDPQSSLLLSVRLGAGQGRRYINLKEALALASSNDGGRDKDESSGGSLLEWTNTGPFRVAYICLGLGIGLATLNKKNEDLSADLNQDYNREDFVDDFKGQGTVEQAPLKIKNVATENSNGRVGIHKKKYERLILGIMIPCLLGSVINRYIDSHKYLDSSRKIIPTKALLLLRFCDILCMVFAAYNLALL